jgi:hypothetical protein
MPSRQKGNVMNPIKLLLSSACILASTAACAQESPSAAAAPMSSLSRAEVLADLVVWQRSGMAALHQGEAGPPAFDAAYRAAQTAYVALREAPSFAALVRQIAAQTGERTEIAAQ